jgi:hypothetical protein
MARRGEKLIVAAAVLLLGLAPASAEERPDRVDSIRDIFARMRTCWKPPPTSKAHPIDITVIVSFNRDGEIMGHPRITYESQGATDNDRLQYRIAVMEALQRCTPMPFTETMAGASAGRPFAIQFRGRKSSPQETPQAKERRA